MKVGIIQQHNTADYKDNAYRLSNKAERLAKEGAELIVMQELHNSLYFCQKEDYRNFDLAEPIPGQSTELFGLIAKRNKVVIVTSLFEQRGVGVYCNTAVVLDKDGTIAGKYRKMHIPDDPGYYEKYYFMPGDIGFQPIQTSIGKLGIMICWDQWFPEAARIMALRGAEMLIYPTAIGYNPDDKPDEQQRQREAWITVQRGHAVANGIPVVTVNRVGTEIIPFSPARHYDLDTAEMLPGNIEGASRIDFWGSSFVAGPQGELLYQASETDEEEVIIDIDMTRSEKVRRWWPFLRDRRVDKYGDILKKYAD